MDGPSRSPVSIPEILDEILKYLDRPMLKQAVCVSLAFHEASIKRLWSGLDLAHGGNVFGSHFGLLMELQKLLPPDILPTEGSENTARPSAPDDWTRFKHYASQAKAIEITTQNYPSGLFALLNTQPTDLFPRLQMVSVAWNCVLAHPELDWINLIKPSLKTLKLHTAQEWMVSGGDCIPVLALILEQIRIRAPNIQGIVCSGMTAGGEKIPEDLAISLGDVIQGLTQISTFTWTSGGTHMPPKLLHVLSALPRLSQFVVQSAFPHEDLPPPMETWFPALKYLRLHGNPAHAAAWLGSLGSPHSLSQLRIRCQNLPPSFNAVNLVILYLLIDCASDWDGLRPLVTCTSMVRCIIISPKSVTGLDDSTLGALALSWKGLEEFTLKVSLDEVAVTFLALASFSSSCPRLRHLKLTMTTRLDRYYGDTWPLHYRRVVDGTYASSPLASLCITAPSPTENTETTKQGLGLIGVGCLIRRLWPSLEASRLLLRGENDTKGHVWKMEVAILDYIKLYDTEIRLRAELENKESELNALREQLNRLQK